MSTARPLGVIELLTRIGEDNVRVQNVVESATNFALRGKGRGRATAITFLTDALTPSDVMRRDCPVVGLVLWLPTALVLQAREEHAAATPSSVGRASPDALARDPQGEAAP